ncbi:GOLPH3/VPS74 family protein [Alkalibacillus sp. S2W]|uniref:GOLPH3/VPS74 family protein n=1 Tax=Alkalibacillus sp. S2W TaxID=3386553 RepID=UPI00398C8493
MLLPERLLLLGTRREKGTIPMSVATRMTYGLAGATLMELAFREKLDISKKQLHVVDAEPTGISYLDDALNEIRRSKKPRKAKHWVQKLGRKRLQLQVYERLVEEGVVRDDTHQFLGIFPMRRYPIEQSVVLEELMSEIKEATFTEDLEQLEDSRIVSLLGLIYVSELRKFLFAKEEQKEAKKRLKAIMESDVLARSVSEAVQAVETAVMGAVAGAAVASSSSS